MHYNKWHHVALTYDGSKKASGVRIYLDETAVPVVTESDALFGSIKNDAPAVLGIGRRFHPLHPEGLYIGSFKIFNRQLNQQEVSLLGDANSVNAIVGKKASTLAKNELALLKKLWLISQDEKQNSLTEDLSKLLAEDYQLRQNGTIAHVMQEKASKPKAFVLDRGAYDKRLDEVEAHLRKLFHRFQKSFHRIGLDWRNG